MPKSGVCGGFSQKQKMMINSESTREPIIMAWVANLMFSSRIENAARNLGLEFVLIERAADLVPGDSPGNRNTFMDRITHWGPALIVSDLGNSEVPWEEWINWLRTASSTRRIPVVCFGSHKDVDTLRMARSAGADAVLARSRFFSSLPETIQKYAYRIDGQLLADDCLGSLHEKAKQGIEQFNQGQYFEAHELLETAWMEDPSVGRNLYRAILQVAVAYYQIQNDNYPGAVKMFLRLRGWINSLPRVCKNVDVEKLRQDAFKVYEQVLALGPKHLTDFETRSFQPIFYSSPVES